LVRTAATRKRLSGLTLIGITIFPAACTRAPGSSEPSGFRVYTPTVPSSLFET
jgi:hypothetical protein